MGSPNGNWFPWLKNELAEKGWNIDVPAFPTPEKQSLNNWLETIKGKKADVLIGHSLGATLALRIVEKKLIDVRKIILVSCVIDEINIEEYDKLNSSFIDGGFDWNAVQSQGCDIDIIHGDNDPYVPVSHAKILSDKLNVPLNIIKNGGHLNSETGYTNFPEILEFLK